MPLTALYQNWKQKKILLYRRWPWHVLFWTGYVIFRFWVYYITVNFYPAIFLQYMLITDVLIVAVTYYTLWLYRRLFTQKNYLAYFTTGTFSWIIFLYARTEFQFYYLRNEQAFKTNTFTDIFINNITFVIVYFLFITSCKFFKDGFISQQFETEKKQQQLLAEVNNLKSQIAPHFLFNTLNNLYGLAVEKSEKLPDLMLRLSDLLRHSLYDTQKALIPLAEEIDILKSYIDLETIRLEDDVKLQFVNSIPEDSDYQITPLILIVFVENAFKHAKFVESPPVEIHIQTTLENAAFVLTVKNNYNPAREKSENGIGLANVKRRLEILYHDGLHELSVSKNEKYFNVRLSLKLVQ